MDYSVPPLSYVAKPYAFWGRTSSDIQKREKTIEGATRAVLRIANSILLTPTMCITF